MKNEILRRLLLAALVLPGLAYGAGAQSGGPVVTVDASTIRQAIRGWGATGGATLGHPDSLVSPVLDEYVNGMGLTRLRFELPGGNKVQERRWEWFNDDGNPDSINWNAFNRPGADARVSKIDVPFKQRVEANGEPFELYVSPSFFDGGSSGSVPAWLLESPGEYAEFAASILLYLKNTHGLTADYYCILNEAGNNNPFTAAVVGRMIKTLGPKLQALGLPTRIQFPECVNADTSWNYIQALQNDADVWPHISLLSYHLYGGNGSRPNIRDFGIARGIPTAQTEYMGLTVNHLYDDLTLGGVSTWEFYGPNDYLPLNSSRTWFSRTGTYWNCRQIIRYVRPGAVRVEAASSDPLLRPLAFVKGGKVTLVLLNNTGGGAATVTMNGLPAGSYGASQTIGGGVTQELGLRNVSGAATIGVPSNSIVTLYPHPGGNLPPAVTDYKANPSFLTRPASTATLSASAADPEKDTVSFAWSVTQQPAGASASFAAPTSATTSVSGLTAAGDYVFTVSVSDPAHTVTRRVLLTVYSGNQAPKIIDLHNRIPVVITLPTSSTTLRAGGQDLEGDALTYQWSVVSQPAGASVALATPTAASCAASNMTVAGDYVFRFQASDPTHTVWEDLTVPVYPANAAPVISSASASPAAITLPTNSTALSAATSDPGGDVITHWWSVKSAPAGAQPAFATPGAAATSVSGLTVAGTYVFTLAVIDRTLVTRRDVTVTVSPGGNAAPTISITSPANGASFAAPASITIQATASDTDGTVARVEFFQGTTKLGEDTTSPYSFAWSNVAAGSYSLTAKATDNNGAATTSSAVTITVVAPPPAAPSGLTASAGSSNQIDLSWTDNASNETGFKIERKTGSGGTYAEIATVGANVTSYSNTGLPASTTYYYRVRATNAAGNSAYSNEANATTQAPPPAPPAAPSGLAASAVSSARINLSWTDNASNETGFKIERKTGSGGAYAEIATVGANVTTYQNTGLSASTTYYYRVRATNAAGDSAYSNEANSTTQAPAGGPGLTGDYYNNTDFTGHVLTRTDAQVNFNWGTGSPDAAVGADTFSVRWTGRVLAEFSEVTTFTANTDDGVRLWVNGELLVDQWADQSPTEHGGSLALTAGTYYTIEMDYYENGGGAVAQLFWSSASTPKELIPQAQLDPAAGPPDARDNDGDGTSNDQDPDDDNDGTPDLQDSDRDGDGAANAAEEASGTDPDDRNSYPGIMGGGDDGGHGRCGALGIEGLLLLGILLRIRRRG